MSQPNAEEDYKKRIKNDMDDAISYTKRKQKKHDAEMDMIRQALKYIQDVETFLDAPCGTGRATILLARSGFKTTGVDLGEAAVTVAKQKVEEAGISATIQQDNLENFQMNDGAFDATLCFRVYHHFPNNDIRERVIQELCRVSKKYVLISYLDPYSYTSLKRSFREKFFNKPSRQHATSLQSIKHYFEAQGFTLIKDIPQQRFFKSLHLCVFERIT